jgi:hypothetical protein
VGRDALWRPLPQGRLRRRRARPAPGASGAPDRRRRPGAGRGPARPPRAVRARRDAPLPRPARGGPHPAPGGDREPGRRPGGPGGGALGRLEPAAGRLRALAPGGGLGRGDPGPALAPPPWRGARAGEPPGPHQPPGQPLLRPDPRGRDRRGPRPGVVRAARLERQLADRRAHDARLDAGDGGHLRLRLPLAAGTRGALRHPRLRRGLLRRRARGDVAAAAPPRAEPRAAAPPRPPPRPLQLLGGHVLPRDAGGSGRPGGPGGRDRGGALRRRRRLVSRAGQRPARPGRLGAGRGALPPGARPACGAGARAGHALRALGRAGDGQPGQRPPPRPSGLGAALPAPTALGAPPPARAQLRPRGRAGARLRRAGPPALRRTDLLREVGPQPAVDGAGLARGPAAASARGLGAARPRAL